MGCVSHPPATPVYGPDFQPKSPVADPEVGTPGVLDIAKNNNNNHKLFTHSLMLVFFSVFFFFFPHKKMYACMCASVKLICNFKIYM